MTNHRILAHTIINIDIDNALDELHDRALDDYATMIEPHLESLRALAIARHDIDCTDLRPIDLSNFDDIDHAAFDTDPDTLDCLTNCIRPISDLLYSYYRD